ncbi:G1 family glutamic endopeptidase [Alicyclobacillus fastidiosus]|uniref:G1 family endopeptidase n=1 Tax=Alicyclobacillus fastidiosus TaxID=392011 RepID=A0ABV5ABA2_9BACL|nr:G1 family glutamic endopeptidase [Alicyclobacillus fastidiosus]WEH10488.1 G1 family endopeptidase [Alicyclobacillus fastidiosus]
MANVRHGPHRAPKTRIVDTSGIANAASYGWSSTNWSGYAISSDVNGTYKSVTASWKVPTVKPPSGTQSSSLWGWLGRWLASLFGVGPSSSDAYSATWIGIDGFTNSNLIQAGTAQNIVNGSPQYYAWWEILPAAETEISPVEYPVSGGDVMAVSIAQQGDGTWQIQLQNQTRGWTFTKSGIQYTGPQTSVEWIEEAPEVNGSVTALANYGEVYFTNLTVNGANPHLQLSEAGIMVQNSQQVSTPSAPGPSLNDFNIQDGAAQPPAPTV